MMLATVVTLGWNSSLSLASVHSQRSPGMLPTSETQLAAPPVSQPVQDKTIDVIKIEDEPEDVIRPCTDSTRSSDVELNTEDETDDYAYADIDENEIDEHSEVRVFLENWLD